MASTNEILEFLAIASIEQAEVLSEETRDLLCSRSENSSQLSEKKFIKLFRLNKEMVDFLVERLSPFMSSGTRTSSADARSKILVSLRFLATGSYQKDIGLNRYTSASQPTVSRSLHQFVDAIHSSGVFKEMISFPNCIEEINRLRQRFYEKHAFPGVMGCIDCTHVAIIGPGKNDARHPEHVFVNRKGYHSINVQLICDSDLKILNVNAKYPGNTHDSFIWNQSNGKPFMENLCRTHPMQYFLIGDSGYALRPWLLIPIEDAIPGTAEEKYNKAQRSTRSDVERLNGILKMRFRCLLRHRTLNYNPEMAAKIINTCCALHNMCITAGLDCPEMEEGDDPLDGLMDTQYVDIVMEPALRRVNPLLAEGRRLRRILIRNHFTD